MFWWFSTLPRDFMFNTIKNLVYGVIKIGFWGLCVAFLIGTAILLTKDNPTSGQGTSATKTTTRGDDLAHLAHNLRRSLESQAKNPDSFDLMQARANLSTGAVCLKYRAQNSFGGMSIERAGLREGDNNIMIDTHPDFDDLWLECIGPGSVGGDAIYKIRD
jgi:hypothetical protein